ncbi:mCG1026209, isoform CRA_b, partial [Mus musculus]
WIPNLTGPWFYKKKKKDVYRSLLNTQRYSKKTAVSKLERAGTLTFNFTAPETEALPGFLLPALQPGDHPQSTLLEG